MMVCAPPAWEDDKSHTHIHSIMDTQMDAQLDLLCFDLFDFDMKHPVFPGNALMFMIQMTCINIPQDHIPVFSDLYNSKVGTPSDFESVDF